MFCHSEPGEESRSHQPPGSHSWGKYKTGDTPVRPRQEPISCTSVTTSFRRKPESTYLARHGVLHLAEKVPSCRRVGLAKRNPPFMFRYQPSGSHSWGKLKNRDIPVRSRQEPISCTSYVVGAAHPTNYCQGEFVPVIARNIVTRQSHGRAAGRV